MDMFQVRRTAALAACLAAGLLGCSKYYIANTDVEDTGANRKVIEFCEDYRRAVERKDVAKLLELASSHYYEDGRQPDASDDIDYAGLRDYLESKFADARAIRYEIRYRRVVRRDDRVFVDYTYSGSVRLPTGGGGGESWRSTVDENRLELVADGESFKIVSGM